ncbi:hypothetical protein KKF34_14300 [Myxococcota bacterium]|nr:hypothetical protein [Myxococcota bacterium]MBU1380727.1 hypothetical protein [Myxococcota bacterium]MBU1498045.1 hypothetical protein [Myxococcota bacterium]
MVKIVGILLLISACTYSDTSTTTDFVRKRGEFDLRCNEVTVMNTYESTWWAMGCGYRIKYHMGCPDYGFAANSGCELNEVKRERTK